MGPHSLPFSESQVVGKTSQVIRAKWNIDSDPELCFWNMNLLFKDLKSNFLNKNKGIPDLLGEDHTHLVTLTMSTVH